MLDAFFAIYKGFFSRAFWFGSFLPVAIFAAVHASLAAVQFPNSVPLIAWLTGDAKDAAKLVPMALAALVVLAYAISPLLPVFRAMLDGTLLPAAWQEGLRQERVAESGRAALLRFDAASQAAALWQRLKDTARDTMVAGRKVGETRPFPAGDDLIREAERRVTILVAASGPGQLPDPSLATACLRAVDAALQAGTADPSGNDPRTDRIDTLKRTLLRCLLSSSKEADLRLGAAVERMGDSPEDHFRATRIGDVRDRTESYSKRVYGVDFAYLWPRLQTSFDKDDKLIETLTDTKSQVDFALLSLALAVTVPLVWLPLLAANAARPWLFLGVAIGAPLIIAFFNELVVQSQDTFGTMVEAIIDKYRLEVLTRLLRQPMPVTRAAERAAWARVCAANDPRTGTALTYWIRD